MQSGVAKKKEKKIHYHDIRPHRHVDIPSHRPSKYCRPRALPASLAPASTLSAYSHVVLVGERKNSVSCRESRVSREFFLVVRRPRNIFLAWVSALFFFHFSYSALSQNTMAAVSLKRAICAFYLYYPALSSSVSQYLSRRLLYSAVLGVVPEDKKRILLSGRPSSYALLKCAAHDGGQSSMCLKNALFPLEHRASHEAVHRFPP